jgi:hypothetical protein
MGSGLESHCIGCVYSTIRTVNMTYTAALKTTTHPKLGKPYAAT